MKKTLLIAIILISAAFVKAQWQQTLTVSGSTPITWSIETGNLPNGLSLSTGDVISGTPTTAGTYNFTAKATNATGSDTKALSILISPTSDLNTLETATISIYLNPVENYFFVNAENDAVIKLHDILGKEVLSQKANVKTEVNISPLPNGIYNVRIVSGEGVVGYGKVVKQ